MAHKIEQTIRQRLVVQPLATQELIELEDTS
jgi:hypothetical protein